MSRRCRGGHGFVVLLILATYSCSSSEQPSPPTAAETGARVLPIDTVLAFDDGDLSVVEKAEDQLASQCLGEYGYELIPYPENPSALFIDVEFRYGHLDPVAAKSSGYRRPPTRAEQEYKSAVAEVDTRQQQMASDYVAILFGDEQHQGCYPAARETLYGSPGGVSSIPGFADILELQVRSSETLYSSDSAIAVQAEWSECMKAHGYTFSGWFEATLVYPHTSDDDSPVSPSEITQALADVECRVSTDLESRLFEGESQILDQLIEENSELIAAYRDSLAAVVARAKSVVSG